jgi:hypothetical protein
LSNAKNDWYNQSEVDDYTRFWTRQLTVTLPTDGFRLWAIGSGPRKRKLLEAAERIRAYRKRYPDRWLEIANTLARIIVQRSTQTPVVGSTVQVSIMPRVAIGQQYTDMSVGPPPDPLIATTSVEFNPAVQDGITVIDGVNVVADGVQIFGSQFSSGPLPDVQPFGPPPHPWPGEDGYQPHV